MNARTESEAFFILDEEGDPSCKETDVRVLPNGWASIRANKKVLDHVVLGSCYSRDLDELARVDFEKSSPYKAGRYKAIRSPA